jgi:hypothetical protein
MKPDRSLVNETGHLDLLATAGCGTFVDPKQAYVLDRPEASQCGAEWKCPADEITFGKRQPHLS